VTGRALAAVLASAALALAIASLLLPWALAFDPYAWLVWGREVGRLELDTSAGPSWKPLPVLATALLAPLGSEAGPAAWVVVARAGALLALLGAGTLAHRLGAGRLGATAAALLVALSPWWWFNAALANSEGLLAAAVLWAAVAHLRGRQSGAFLALVIGSLLRPEVWPFLGLYGLWLTTRGPRRTAARPLVAASFAAIPLLWFVPGALGGGGASEAAQGPPSAGSAALAAVPFLAVLEDAVRLLTVPVALALLAALLLRERRIAVLAAAAAGYVLLVAVMTQAGYAGNPRYLVPAAALLATLAAVGAARLATPAAAGVLVLIVAGLQLGDLREQTREIGERAAIREELARAVPAGAELACMPVRTAEPQRAAVAWWLDLPLPATSGRARGAGTELRPGTPWRIAERC
jgi:hypothetical protein